MFDFFKKKITIKEFIISYSGFNHCYNYCRENYDHRIHDNYCDKRYRKIIISLLEIAKDGSDTEKLYDTVLNGFEWTAPNGTPRIDFQRAAQKYVDALNKLKGNEFEEARAKVLNDKFSVNNINQVIQTSKENGTWSDIVIKNISFDDEKSWCFYDIYNIEYKKDDKNLEMELGIFCSKRENLTKKHKDKVEQDYTYINEHLLDENFKLNPLMNQFQFEQFFSIEKIKKILSQIHNEPLCEFYFDKMPNEIILAGKILSNKEFPYYVITETVVEYCRYEGTFSKTTYKEQEEGFDDESLLRVIEYKNGVKHGKFRTFHDEGVLAEIGEYNNGLRHGNYKEFHYTGELELELEFKDDYITTKNLITYNEYGEKAVTGTFKEVNGKKPTIEELYNLKNSEFATGIWNYYDIHGNLKNSINFEDNLDLTND